MQSRKRRFCLAGTLQDSPMSETSVTVAKYSMPLEAQLAKGLLESEGIPVQLSGDLTATMLNYGAAGGLVELRVPAADADRALRILHLQHGRVRPGDDWAGEAGGDARVWLARRTAGAR